ncbi:MAG: pilus assembly protein TadG-related protein [Candidatus Omnitrophota bacterium]|jgi:hypothetical protein
MKKSPDPRNKETKTQVSIFFLSVIVTLIVITFVTVNIGKVAKDQTYSDNAADAGALAAASVMAYAFNYVANVNAGSGDETFKESWKSIEQEYNEHFNHASSRVYTEYTTDSTTSQSQTCQPCSGCSSIVGTAAQKAHEASYNAEQFAKEMDSLIKNGFKEVDENYEEQSGDGVVPSGAQENQALIEAVRARVHDDDKNPSDLYQNALYAGYIYNFSNSGISHRLGKINSKRYSQFLETEITPEALDNCVPKTFSWVDGAARFHSVTAVVCIDDAHSYKLKIAQDDRDTVKQKLEDARQHASNAAEAAGTVPGQWANSPMEGQDAETVFRSASACCGEGCCGIICVEPCGECGCPTCCPDKDLVGETMLAESADPEMTQANNYAEQAKQGLDGEKDQDFDNKDSSEDYIIKHIVDINHNRQVQSTNIQFHMGSPIKGMRGDIDIPTVYPPVQSQATADFSGSGKIESGQASHDSSL